MQIQIVKAEQSKYKEGDILSIHHPINGTQTFILYIDNIDDKIGAVNINTGELVSELDASRHTFEQIIDSAIKDFNSHEWKVFSNETVKMILE